MAQNSLQELSRRSVVISKYEDLCLESQASFIAMCADRTIRIFEYTHNLQCTDKKIDCLEYLIKVPLSSPASGLFKLNNGTFSGMELSKMVLDPAFWPHSTNIIQEMADIISFKWSPVGLWNNYYLLAVLNNMGHVVFYSKQRNKWIVDFNLSALIVKHYATAFNLPSKNMECLTKAVETLVTCAICWAPSINEDLTTLFVTAQRNGTLLFWLIRKHEKGIKAELIGEIDTAFNHIVTIAWIPKGSKINLVCANNLGQIFIKECCISQSQNVTLIKTHTIWSDNDRMVMKHCSYIIKGDKIILLFNKHRHLVAQLLSDDCQILSQSINNLNDNRITKVCISENTFYVSTVNASMYKINCTMVNEILDLKWDLIIIKDLSPTHELLSMSFSSNRALIALGLIDRKVMNRKEPLKIDVVYYSATESDFSECLLLLNNPTKKLSNYWDCIEVTRYQIIKRRRIPEHDYVQLLSEGESDVYKLKVYLILLIICNVLEDQFKIEKGVLPENSVEVIKEKIAAVHANNFINNLYDKYLKNSKTLSEFEIDCVKGCIKYLEIINKKHKIPTNIPSEFLNIVGEEEYYVCQGCDERLVDYKCKNGHLNAFCCLTFTPIEDEYLICTGCQAIARPELYKEIPMCPYCDLYFEDVCIS